MKTKNIWEIQELLGLKECEQGYAGTYTTGFFDGLHDYDAGLLHILISWFPTGKDMFGVSFTISTIDDGTWQAWDVKSDYTEVEAIARVEEIAIEFLSRMGRCGRLPTEAILNEWLMPLKLWGTYTG